MKTKIFSALLLLIFLITCSNKESPTENKNIASTDILLPLKVGNFWKESGISGSGSRYNDDIRIVSQKKILDLDAYGIVKSRTWSSGMFDVSDTVYYVNKVSGLYAYSEYSKSFKLKWKIPDNVNEVFLGYLESHRNEDVTKDFTIKSINTTVEVPAGVFQNCIVYEAKWDILGQGIEIDRQYVKPGLGRVKEEYIYEYNGEVNMRELIEYNIK